VLLAKSSVNICTEAINYLPSSFGHRALQNPCNSCIYHVYKRRISFVFLGFPSDVVLSGRCRWSKAIICYSTPILSPAAAPLALCCLLANGSMLAFGCWYLGILKLNWRLKLKLKLKMKIVPSLRNNFMTLIFCDEGQIGCTTVMQSCFGQTDMNDRWCLSWRLWLKVRLSLSCLVLNTIRISWKRLETEIRGYVWAI